MSLEPPEKVGKLQTALHAKAKASPSYRFYLLYDKLYRWDVLAYAYLRCKSNKGAAAWMVRPSRTSRRTGRDAGWKNW
jgi:RNA-directed DNA polymerase